MFYHQKSIFCDWYHQICIFWEIIFYHQILSFVDIKNASSVFQNLHHLYFFIIKIHYLLLHLNLQPKRKIEEDINQLQILSSKDVFWKGIELFQKIWESEETSGVREFLHYFKSQWITSNYGWFEAYSPSCPSTNNCLEAINSFIKHQHIFREWLPLSRFLTLATSVV